MGTNYDRIVCEVSMLLDDTIYFKKMSEAINPYGNGKACKKIVDFFKLI